MMNQAISFAVSHDGFKLLPLAFSAAFEGLCVFVNGLTIETSARVAPRMG